MELRHCLLILMLLVPFVANTQEPDPSQDSAGEPRGDTIFADQEAVAEDELEQQAQSAGSISDISREQAQSLYQTHIAAGQFDEAVDAARYGVELLETEVGADNVELAPALNDLGTALLRNDMPQEALLHFERSADLLRDHQGLFTRELYQPLLGQGYAQQMVGEHELAVDSFRRGQHVIHRNEGVLGLAQVPAIEAMAESLMALGEANDAERLRLLPLKLYQSKFGRDDPRTTAGFYSLANWYVRRGDFRQALVLYDRALRLENKAGRDPTASLPGLEGQVAVYSRRHSQAALEQALKIQQRVVEIYESEQPSQDQIEAQLLLGDLFVRDGSWPPAEQAYRKAMALANQISGTDNLFSEPRLIYAGPAINAFQAPRDETPYYDFSTSITADGRAESVEILGTNVRGRTRSQALQHFKQARFRPRMENNEFITTDNFVVRRSYQRVTPQRAFNVRF